MDEIGKKGVLIMNLGSPDSTAVPDVRKYLHEFLMDKRVIDYPYLFRKLLVDGVIVRFRAPKSAEAYKSIWWKEGSPLIVLSKQLQELLQKELPVSVSLGMRYGNPSTEHGFNELLKNNPSLEEVLLIPLYPHYAMSSYETAVEYAKKIHQKNNYPFRITTLKPFYNHPAYINALSESIRPFLQQEFDYLLFSYHGVPERHIRKSDITHGHCLATTDCCEVSSPAHDYCYRHQVRVTTSLVGEALQLPQEKYGLSFQSRLGREEWLKPYTVMRLAELPKEGVKKLLVVCPAFVSDCLETLEEIAEQGKHTFMENGGKSFGMIPCLNTQLTWIKVLSEWITSFSGESRELVW
jgi:protoporphyrin/coproporphyrin ferrochelatase